ncbi:MAG TPA: anti-sigma factor [Thermoanaerobaculia bacterium]|nr:anti-sigma factor [Thermoanaerobaculia bacterium]
MTHDEIESIAALDAIGAATPEEQGLFAEHVRDCLSCRRARDEYAEAATLLARDLAPVAPPAALRDAIVGAVDEDDEEETRERGPRINPWWLATAATLFLALWGWREIGIRVTRTDNASKQAEIARLEEENRLLAQKNEKLSSEMTSLSAAGTRTIALVGKEVAPSASARVFLEPERRRAIVFFHNLPPNAGDKSYQLWIIRADQPAPMSAGVFDVTESGSASLTVENLPVETEMKALAVTLEPKGGAAQPTNTRFYVMGTT